MLCDRSRAQLMIIDVQEKLAPHVDRQTEVIAHCERLVRYARRLSVPMTITEHYPKGLGATTARLKEAAGQEAVTLEKIAFSAWMDEKIRARLERLRDDGHDQIVVAGMESHVCVGQTVQDLLTNDFDVFVVADATSSRSATVRECALTRLARAGAEIVTHEMVAFEWLERGDTPAFKELIDIIK